MMKSLYALALCVIAGCASAQAAVNPGEAAAVHAHALTLRGTTPSSKPDVTPSLRCGGDKVITHGDGHTTPCPGCEDCRAKNGMVRAIDLIQPAAYVRITKLTRQQCADGSCTVDTAPDCDCTKTTGSCNCGDTTVETTSGDCASGSCGASGSGPVRKLVAARPVRRAVGAIAERRPVRRLFGRLFGRR